MKRNTMANNRAVLATVAIFLAACALAVPARAGTQINRAMKLEPGGRFVLETFAGTVNVMGSNESGADVVITSPRDDIQSDVDFDFEQNPGEVDIKAVRRDPWSFFFGGFYQGWLHYDIRVPKNTQVVIRTSGGGIKVFALAGDTELHTSGGSIEASQVAGNLRASSSGGNIHAEVIHGDAQLSTSGGGIEADAIDGPLRAYTSGGWVHINGVVGRVDAHTSGGSIDAVFNKGDSSGGSLSTSGGSINVKVDPAVNLDIEASTSGGVVRSDLPVHQAGDDWSNGGGWHRKTHLRGTLGSGGDMLQMHTSGGSIHISGL
ncbi:MAG: DUF4097 family beta strand repeat-containing protein [Candidatus Acidiferrales bacterium]